MKSKRTRASSVPFARLRHCSRPTALSADRSVSPTRLINRRIIAPIHPSMLTLCHPVIRSAVSSEPTASLTRVVTAAASTRITNHPEEDIAAPINRSVAPRLRRDLDASFVDRSKHARDDGILRFERKFRIPGPDNSGSRDTRTRGNSKRSPRSRRRASTVANLGGEGGTLRVYGR